MPENEPATVLTVTVDPAITDAKRGERYRIPLPGPTVDVDRLRPQVVIRSGD